MSLLSFARYAVWAGLAGAFIPVMAALNARLGRALGEPVHAVWCLFAVGLLAASVVSLAVSGRLPAVASLRNLPPVSLAGGLIVAFYVLSVTLLVPRLGVGVTILFAVSAQVLTSALIDHYGLLGVPVRPVGAVRAFGLALLILGLTIAQLAPRANARPSVSLPRAEAAVPLLAETMSANAGRRDIDA
jgi:bacterial/archaeal transporter family-2 protein